MTEHQESQTRTLDELIGEFGSAMLVTESVEGRLRARPMMIAEHDAGAVLWFATRVEDEKLEEILHRSDVAVTLQGEGRFLSISGNARIETDQVKLDEAWSASWTIWFPEGSRDPSLCLICVEPTCAEYWDRTGPKRLEFILEAGKALIRGEKLPDDDLSGHAKVSLD
jgi:general stress protein 26